MNSVVILLLITCFSEVIDINLSGDLVPQRAVNKKDVIDYTFRGTSRAILTPGQYIISVNGGTVDIEGKENAIDIIQNYCVVGVPCTDLDIYFIDVTGSSTILSIEKCIFNMLDKHCSVIRATNTQNLDISNCEITGSLFMFGKFSNSKVVSVSQCVFRNLRGEVDDVFLFYGFILTVVNCDVFSIDDCTFKNVSTGEFSADTGAVKGYIAPVFIHGGKNVEVHGSKFEGCSGLLSGGIVSSQPGKKGKYKRDHFTGNSYLLPTSDLPTILNTLPRGGELSNVLNDYTELGNDITRLGGTKPKVELVCSTSVEPHFRSDLSTENFGSVCRLFTTWEIVKIVLGSVGVVIIALAIVLCCCCGCCCAGCYRCCCCSACCSRCCYRTHCRQANPNDFESPTGTDTATTTAPPQTDPQQQNHGFPSPGYPLKDNAQQGCPPYGFMQQVPLQGGGYAQGPEYPQGQGYLQGQVYALGQGFPQGYPQFMYTQTPQQPPFVLVEYPQQGQYYPPPQNLEPQTSCPDKEGNTE